MAIILLVDDDESFLELVAGDLETSGHTVTQVSSLIGCLELLSGGTAFDLAIVDFWLGGTDSMSILDLLRKEHPRVPIIAISGGSGSMSVEKSHAIAAASGSASFLQKPFTREELLDAVEEITD